MYQTRGLLLLVRSMHGKDITNTLQGWSEIIPSIVQSTLYFVHGTAMGTAKNCRRSTALDIPKILKRLPFAVFGLRFLDLGPTVGPLRCISYIMMGPLPPLPFESVR